MITDIEEDDHGYSAIYVLKNQEWASVHSQSNSQDSSRFTGAS
jgi:hypothetical protein